MRAIIHLLPWLAGDSTESFELDVSGHVSAAEAAEILFGASNTGTATAPSRSMSVGDVAEVFAPGGRVLLGCAGAGWVVLAAAVMPTLARLSAEQRGRLFGSLQSSSRNPADLAA